MDLQLHERIDRVHHQWFTAAFWVILVGSIYGSFVYPYWEWWLVLAALGGAASYCWWRARRPQKLGKLWGLTCGLIATATLLAGGRALLTPISVATDSVGNNRVVCGSIVNPIPGDELRETDGLSGEPVVRDQLIPQSEFERVCTNNMNYRTGDVVGADVIGLLFVLRATGHLVRRPADASPNTL
ncbi:hypothetical protein O4220_06250 [Rhodococcus ruber]|uniref:Uncharacterized protein n=1 Tax=Rhodococcus ruber TaxID=1830 RepID=A0ABT4MAW3_9NOCA|nr:hypothetical protein [Rhodococcus ruber]MCZ4518114.1 hypothetical protein [Rhodococcus ruber]